MKNFFCLTFCFVFLSLSAQISSLSDLAAGEMQMFTPIYEKNDDVYGYFSLFKKDKLNEKEEKYEYVILDKNLNKVANGEFVDIYYKGIFSSYFKPEKIEDNLLLTKQYSNMSGTVAFTANRFLNLNDNALGDPFYFEDYLINYGSREAKTLKKDQKSNKFFNLPITTKTGYILIEGQKKATKNHPTQVQYYNLQNEKLWEYHFKGDDRKSEYSLVAVEDSMLYFTYSTHDFNNSSIQFLQIDENDGQLKFNYLLENGDSNYSYQYRIKKIGEKTVLTGKFSQYYSSGYNRDKPLGLFKTVLDGTGKEIFKKHILWEDMSEFFEMSEKGKLEAGYKLFAHAYFIFNDERIVVLSEKFKLANNLLLGPHIKTEDFILFEFDSDFNLVNGTAIEKDMSKFSNSDFLFAQYLNEEKDAVFFYNDYQKDSETKDKNWILGIVSLIDGEKNHEKIPMISDDYAIYPYIAKEGYILLREFNKNSDFDKIRLERLNF